MNNTPIMCEKLLLLKTENSPAWWNKWFEIIGDELFAEDQRIAIVDASNLQKQIDLAYKQGFWPTVVAPSMPVHKHIKDYLKQNNLMANVLNIVAHQKQVSFLLRRPSKRVIEAFANDSLVVFDEDFNQSLECLMKTDLFCVGMIERIKQRIVDLNECILVSSDQEGTEARYVVEWVFSRHYRFNFNVSKSSLSASIDQPEGFEVPMECLVINGQKIPIDDDCLYVELSTEQVKWIVEKFELPQIILDVWHSAQKNDKFFECVSEAGALGQAFFNLPLRILRWLKPVGDWRIENQRRNTFEGSRSFLDDTQKTGDAALNRQLTLMPNNNVDNDEYDAEDYLTWSVNWSVTPTIEPTVSIIVNSNVIESDISWDEELSELKTNYIECTDEALLSWTFNDETNHLIITIKE
jgi:hypothetical protein